MKDVRRILVFSTNYLPNIGGAELAIAEIAKRLPDIDFELVTARLSRSVPAVEEMDNVIVYRVGLGISFDRFLLPILGFFKANSLFKAEKHDLVWSMMASQASVAAAFFKIVHRRVPLILTLQEGDEEDHLKRYVFGNDFLYRFLIRPWHTLVFKVSDGVTVISDHLKSRARENNVAVPIELIPNGVDCQAFSKGSEFRDLMRKHLRMSDTDRVIISVSRLVEKNRIEDVIRALAFLPDSFKFVAVGDGTLREGLKKLSNELGVSHRVTFAGSVPAEFVPDYLAGADMFVRPSASEGFGSAFIEAMAAGLPVIATPVGGIRDFITDKKTGLFCGVKDPKDLALKIQMLVRDKELRETLILNGKEMVENHYDWKIIAKAMHDRAFRGFAKLSGKRILISTAFYPPSTGSQAKYAKHLHDAFIEKGYAAAVVSYRRVNLPSGLRHAVHFFRLLLPVYMSDWVLSLDSSTVGVPTAIAAWLLRRKAVVRVGGDFLWEQYVDSMQSDVTLPDFYKISLPLKYRMLFSIIRFQIRRYHRVVFNTVWQRDLWLKPYHLNEENTAVIENYYGEKLPSSAPTKKNFVWAGREARLKNVERMKKAFADAQKRNSAVSLELLELPHEALMLRIKEAYAVILPSLSDVSPNLIAEAIQFERPFILTKYTGIRDRVRGLGLIVDPLNEKDMSDAILKLADDAAYGELKENLRLFAFTHTWPQIAQEFIDVFKKDD